MIVGGNPGAGRPDGLLRLWDCGVTWAHLQPAPDEWRFGELDALVGRGGDGVMLVLGHPPAWAAAGGPDGRHAAWLPPGSNRPPAADDDWVAYVRAVARRYRGRIGWYQVWNEPADPAFYTGRLGRLAELAAFAEDAVLREDPAAVMVSAPLLPRPASGWPRRADRLMAAYRAAGYPVDAWACHVYPETGEGPARWEELLAAVERLLADHGQAGRPLWVTETNYNVPSGPPLDDATAREHVLATERIAVRHGVEGLLWYAADGWFGVQPSALRGRGS